MASKFTKDTIYASKLDQLLDFEFDQNTVQVFPDMINRSVPGYAHLVSLIGLIASQSVKKNDTVYDLGCSLGACAIALSHHLEDDQHVEIIAIDQSQAMIDQAQQNLAQDHPHIKLVCDDVQNVDMNNAQVVILNLVLQFIEPDNRLRLIEKIYQALKPGGLLIVAEKIKFDDDVISCAITDWHLQYKRYSGYSDTEIEQKRQALENVMRLDDEQTHISRLMHVGFDAPIKFYQALNFIALCAKKPNHLSA